MRSTLFVYDVQQKLFCQQCKSQMPAMSAAMSWDEPVLQMANMFEGLKRQ